MSARVVIREFVLKHELAGGWHVLTCERLPGLFLSNIDFDKTYDAIEPCAKRLQEAQHPGLWSAKVNVSREIAKAMIEDPDCDGDIVLTLATRVES